MIADLFGRRHYGSIMGTLMTTSAVFGVIAPVLVGLIFDIRGNYREPFLLMSFTILIAIPMISDAGAGTGAEVGAIHAELYSTLQTSEPHRSCAMNSTPGKVWMYWMSLSSIRRRPGRPMVYGCMVRANERP